MLVKGFTTGVQTEHTNISTTGLITISVLHTDICYLDDELGFVTEQMLKDIERIKANDFDYYRYIYLGEPVGLGNNVYNMSTFHPLDSLPANDRLVGISFALDGGHQQSATACGAFGITAKGNVILLDTYYYSPAGKVVKKAPSQLSQDIHSFTRSVVDKYRVQVLQYTIDSAEGALRNQMYLDFAIRWHPVAKLKKVTMIDSFQSLLAQGRFYYLDTEANKIFIEEHRMYRWDEKTIQSDNPNVITQERDSLKNQLQNAETQIETLKADANTSAEQKEALDKLQAEYDKFKADAEADLAMTQKINAINLALKDTNAYNPENLMKFINIDEIELDDDGKPKLDDVINGLKESDAYLFKPEEDMNLAFQKNHLFLTWSLTELTVI